MRTMPIDAVDRGFWVYDVTRRRKSFKLPQKFGKYAAVYLNGLLMARGSKRDYTAKGNVVRFNYWVTDGSRVVVQFWE